ncbi:hypothetical protein ZWY2020_033724 [Hordeum vulgare]|nr:hypothetical protein ZWY2020_033724 [Hordeum vulgare]
MALLSNALPSAPTLHPPIVPSVHAGDSSSAADHSAFVDRVSSHVMPCIALRDHSEASLGAFVDEILGRIFPCVALNALEEDVSSLAHTSTSLISPSRQPRPALLARAEPHAPSWVEVAAPGRPRLRSIIVDHADAPSAPAPAPILLLTRVMASR